jgi:exonuclease SbcC
MSDIEKEENHDQNLKDIKTYISTKEKLKKIQIKLLSLRMNKMEKDTHLDINRRGIQTDSLDIVYMETKIKNLTKSIKQLLQDQNPKIYQQNLNIEKERLEKELLKLKDNFQKQQSQYIANKKLISIEIKNLNQLKKEIINLKEKLLKEIREDNFFTIEELQEAYLEKNEFDKLLKSEENLLQKIQQNQILLSENSQKLDFQTKNPLTEYSLEVLLRERKSEEESLETLSKEIGERENRLKQDLRDRNQQLSLISKVQKQEKEFYKWSRLNDLIGSKDGDKFRKFAQHLTLGYLTQLANQYLEKISQRYLIKTSDIKELEIEIIDTYQANIIRSTNTLSGGERFLVSLSLAFGLSDLVSKNISIESLFLDEGFDTLDEETLDIALSALDYLQHQGKMIGIISHVEVLKERIPTQIHIQKLSGGFSRLVKI